MLPAILWLAYTINTQRKVERNMQHTWKSSTPAQLELYTLPVCAEVFNLVRFE